MKKTNEIVMQAKLFMIGIGIAMTLMLFAVTSVLGDLDFCLSSAPSVSESTSLSRKEHSCFLYDRAL